MLALREAKENVKELLMKTPAKEGEEGVAEKQAVDAATKAVAAS